MYINYNLICLFSIKQLKDKSKYLKKYCNNKTKDSYYSGEKKLHLFDTYNIYF